MTNPHPMHRDAKQTACLSGLPVLTSAVGVLLILTGGGLAFWHEHAGVTTLAFGCIMLGLTYFGHLRAQEVVAEHRVHQIQGEERLSRVLEATQDGIWELDLQGRVFFCTDQCLRLAEVAGVAAHCVRPFLRKLSQDQRHRLLRAVREAWNESGRFDELVYILGHNGSKRWLRVRAGVSRERRYMTGALSDVSEEVELTRERGLNQSFIEGVMDSLPLPISVKSHTGVLMLANRAYCAALQVQPWEVIGKTANQIVPGEVAERLDSLDRLTLETGSSHTTEDWFEIARIKRRAFLRITKCRCLDRNGRYVVVTTFEDQSVVREYANKMALLSMNVEAFVQRLIRSIPYPIYVKNTESRYLMANTALAEQWGMRVEEMIGLSSRELFGEERGGQIEDEDRRIFAGEVVRKEDCIPDRQTGRPRYWAVSKASCTDVDGNTIIIGANFEITGLRRGEDELREALRQQTSLRQFMQQIFDALPHPLFVKDKNGRFVMTNRAHAEFHGRTPETIIGTLALDYATPEAAARISQAEAAVLAQQGAGAMVESEVVMQDAMGEAHHFMVRRVACDEMDGERVIVGIAVDVTKTRQLEEDLRAALLWQTRNRTFLQDVFDAIPTPVSVKDDKHCYILVNRALADIYGLSPEQIVGKSSMDMNLPDVARETMAADDHLFSIGPGVINERNVPLQYADGKVHRVRLQKSVCLGPDGTRLLITSNSDVTELVEKEDALTISLQRQTKTREFLQTVFDMLPFATYVKDEACNGVLANTALSEFFGIPRHMFVGRPMSELLPEPAARVVDALDRELLARDDGEVLCTEILVPDRLNRERHLLLYEKLVRDADGHPVILGINHDMTELREIERAQRCTLERLDALINNAPLGITLLDSDGRFLQVNPALQQILGRSKETLQQMRYQDVVPRRFRAADEAQIREFRDSGVMQPDDKAIVGADGREIPVLVSGVMAGHGDKESVYWLLVQDLTAQKAAENELLLHRDQLRQLVMEQTAGLLQAKEAAERSSAAKSDFIAKLSHELRTPLHAIMSFARLGEERGGTLTADKTHGYFARIAESGERLISLLDELLELAKLEAGRVSLTTGYADLPTVLDMVAAEFEALFVANQLALTRIDMASLPPVCMDAARISQVMRNLLSNAVKFAPHGSRITLRTGLVDANSGQRLDTVVDGAMVEVSVMDEGPGIPETELDKIFERFTQSSLTRSVAGGTGLGLAICREIVLAHRGQISARNCSTGGAEFIVRLPLAGLQTS